MKSYDVKFFLKEVEQRSFNKHPSPLVSSCFLLLSLLPQNTLMNFIFRQKMLEEIFHGGMVKEGRQH
jgi:hypothetical protein